MQETIKSRTIFCRDNLEVLRGMNSESVDLIYMDPPFNKGKRFHAPIGTSADGASFDDIWLSSTVKDEWHNQVIDSHPDIYKYLDAVQKIGSKSAKYYLIYMAVRLMEMERVLKPTGSIYLHCDDTANHYLRMLMDAIFGWRNFKNELVWRRATSHNNAKRYGRITETIFFYVKSSKYIWNGDAIGTAKTQEEIEKTFAKRDEHGNFYTLNLTAPSDRENLERGGGQALARLRCSLQGAKLGSTGEEGIRQVY